ncbi:MAG: M48 family metallopeptidase [Bacillota bacterium]
MGAEAVHQPQLIFRPSLVTFLGGYALLVLGVALWARILSRQVLSPQLQEGLRRFTRMVHLTRWVIPAWLLFGIFGGAAWAQNVLALAGTRMVFPGLILGTLPAFLTWMGLWWAEFPADRALREQNLLGELEADLPVHAPPAFGRHFATALRQQLLPIVAPVLLIILLRDLIALAAGRYVAPKYEELVMLPAALLVYLVSPELLRYIFNARPLEDSPLRRRLETICRRAQLRYRDILLWQTEYSIANAGVIGILPRWRYILLSDRLLETMSDEHIEAVFAHELGHIVYHHMAWFIVFFAIVTFGALGPGQLAEDWISVHLPLAFRSESFGTVQNVVSGVLVFGIMLILFGMLSRRFERQADVFAARMLECNWGEDSAEAGEPSRASLRRLVRGVSHIGNRGAAIFSGALHRVAVVNSIPLRARDWLHPSIANRMRYLEEMSSNPELTGRFDRFMARLYVGMVLVLLLSVAAAFIRS